MRVDHKATPAEKRQAVGRDSILSVLEDASPEEIGAWVDSNIQSLLDVKDLLKLLLIRLL